MVSFTGGLLIALIIIIAILVIVRRYIYPFHEEKWRNGSCFGRGIVEMYDWIEAKNNGKQKQKRS